MAEATTFVGTTGGTTNVLNRTTFQTLTSAQKISKLVQWACFNKNPFMKAIGIEAFGVEPLQDVNRFGAAQTTGRIIQRDRGAYAVSGQVFTSGGTSAHVGRLGNHTPQLVETGTQYAYAWHRLIAVRYIPDVDVQDNGPGRYVDIKAQMMEGMKQQYVNDINYAILGNSNAPDYGSMGPAQVYSDLPNLISVTQDRTVGGIATTNSYWQNGYKAIASIGGGNEMDRPIALRRSMMDAKNDQMRFAESSDDYLLLATQGAWQYYDRLMYADMVQAGVGAAFAKVAKYDAAGINHKVFDGSPMVWDPAVTVPYGATASTESIYGIHVPTFKLSLRDEEAFEVKDWEQPRAHEIQQTLVAMIRTRYTPMVTARRSHFVCYNLPACPD